MSDLKLTGNIKTVTDVTEGTGKDGKTWKKLTFVVSNNDGYEGAEAIFAFDVFGSEKVEEWLKYNKVGKAVEVSYNIRTNEWKGKYFTSLQAWKTFGAGAAETVTPENTVVETVEDDLPF